MSEHVIIEHLKFEQFRSIATYSGLFFVRRLDDEYIVQSDIDDVSKIITELDLWEDCMSLMKVIYHDFSCNDSTNATVEDNYRADKYHLETSYEQGDETYLVRFDIKYTKNEALRITRGAKNKSPFNIDDLKSKLKNVKKWRKFIQLINVIGK